MYRYSNFWGAKQQFLERENLMKNKKGNVTRRIVALLSGVVLSGQLATAATPILAHAEGVTQAEQICTVIAEGGSGGSGGGRTASAASGSWSLDSSGWHYTENGVLVAVLITVLWERRGKKDASLDQEIDSAEVLVGVFASVLQGTLTCSGKFVAVTELIVLAQSFL